MPYRHEKFSIAIVIIATLSLPLLSVASFQENGEAVGNSIISFGTSMGFFLSAVGSTLDQSLSFVARSAKEGATDTIKPRIAFALQGLYGVKTTACNTLPVLQAGLSSLSYLAN